MAQFSVNGLDDLMDDLLAIEELPDETAEKMLAAEAEVVEEAQVYTGMKMGVYRTGETLHSITHGKMKRGKDGGRSMYCIPRGPMRTGIAMREVAFINEYGAPERGIEPRPFIRTANESAADAAANAAADVYDEFLKSQNL